MSAGKSINLATSYRGWKALDAVGIGDEIRKIAIPMYGRTIHELNGEVSYHTYGINNQAIYSVSRGAINSKLMDIAESTGNTELFFNAECVNVDIKNNISYLKNTLSGKASEVKSDAIFATDGAFSAVRYNAMQKMDKFNYSQSYIQDGYREILLPANKDGSFKLKNNTLHIWPRGRFMLIALPNFDGSFTCTLFMPFDKHKYCFNNLKSKQKIAQFFREVFPDFLELMPNVAYAWEEHPLSSLAISRCYPWTFGNTVLMGDAAHATVPFFGQGMNCGFEDCTVMWQLMQQYKDDWKIIFDKYQQLRKPNGDAMQELSLQNYLVMRDKVTDDTFLLQQKIEKRIHELYPKKYTPMYSMVAFSEIEYSKALKLGGEQDEQMISFISDNNLSTHSTIEKIDEVIHTAFGSTVNA